MIRGKRRAAAAALAFAMTAFSFTTGFMRAEEYKLGQPEYLKSATYYSDDWVINFWNSESKNMDDELAQIAADGFNNIILVIPWREFQPKMSPSTYNDYAWEKLDRVMEAAARQQLSVMLRVGYTWDYYGRDNIQTRFHGLMYDDATRTAWLDYVKRLYDAASAHENFCGGFLTWEDFWDFTGTSATYGKSQNSKAMAQKTGYTQYAREHYSLKELQELYGEKLYSYEALYFPDEKSPARKVFFEFYNDFLNRLLADSQQVFPELSMEVRLDGDPIRGLDGEMTGYLHAETFDCQNASYSSTMYSIPMGMENQFERVTAQQALDMAPRILGNILNYNDGKPIYIDQFLFTDNTIGFEHNAQLQDEEKAPYLMGMAPILKNMTMGYGIWTYRNYCDNKLYNSQFGLGAAEWNMMGGSSIVERGGSNEAAIPGGGSISQDIGNRATGSTGSKTHVRFKADSDGASDLSVQLGNQTKSVSVTGAKTVELTFPGTSLSKITIKNSGAAAYVDDIQVYTYVTDGEMYDLAGQELNCIQPIRDLNELLQPGSE